MVTLFGFLFPALTGCGGGSSSDPTPPPPPTPKTWSLNVGGQVKTITQNVAFDLGKLQLCEVANRGGEWQFSVNSGSVSGCPFTNYHAISFNVANLPDGTKSSLAIYPQACPLSETQYAGNITAHDVNADVTYKLSSFPANFDFSQSGVMHISALKDDGTGNGVLEVATGACPN